jgi:hypothetical protein
MALNPRTSRIVPIALGLALLVLIVAAGLAPQTGAVPAQSNCQYGQCAPNTSVPWWVFAAIAILIVALLAVALILLRRRRPPVSPITPAEGAVGGPTAGAAGTVSPPPSPVPPYVEIPEDMGAVAAASAPATVPSAVSPAAADVALGAAAAGAGAAVAATAADSDEPDIDSLMAELDKISSEILKRPKNPVEKKPPLDEDLE